MCESKFVVITRKHITVNGFLKKLGQLVIQFEKFREINGNSIYLEMSKL